MLGEVMITPVLERLHRSFWQDIMESSWGQSLVVRGSGEAGHTDFRDALPGMVHEGPESEEIGQRKRRLSRLAHRERGQRSCPGAERKFSRRVGVPCLEAPRDINLESIQWLYPGGGWQFRGTVEGEARQGGLKRGWEGSL